MKPLSEVATEPGIKQRRLTDGQDYPCLSLEASTKRELAAHIMRRSEIDLALARVSANPQAFVEFAACYIVGLEGDDRCKIGLSNNPIRRMTQLQTGLWADVKCFGLFWAPALVAQGIETRALQLAAKHGLRLRGEWVDIPPDETVGLVLTAMAGDEAFTSSRLFTEYWAPHKEALYAKGGKLSRELREQASLDAARAGLPQPEPRGWIYEVE